MTAPDANEYAREHGCDALRKHIDRPPRPDGWSLIGEHQIISPRMLVKRLLPYEGVAFIGGQSGSGKRFIAVDLSVAVASDTPFFGYKINERVGVAIVAAEGVEQIGNRLRAAAKARGVNIEDLPIAWLGDAPLLKNARDFGQLGAQLAELGAYIRHRFGVRLGVVILDTVAATFDLEDEDKNSEVAKAIRKMRKIGATLGGLVVPIHHYGKTATTGLRGGSAWRAGADVVLSVIAERKELTGEITRRELALAKARDGIEGPIAPFALTYAQLGVDHDGDPFGTCIVEPKLGEAAAPLSACKPHREPGSSRTFRAAFTEALDASGQTIHVRNDGPTVRAVNIANVKAQFAQRHATGETDPTKRADAQRKAFCRAMDRLSAEFSTCIQGDTEWMWSMAANRTNIR
jgi:hypothetical protein